MTTEPVPARRGWAHIDMAAAAGLTIAVLLPYLRIILIILVSIAAVLNQTTFGPTWHWPAYWTVTLSVLLPAIATLGIVPLVGAAFQKFLAATFPAQYLVTIHVLLTSAIIAGQEALLHDHLGITWSAVVAGGVSVLFGLGFGPAGSTNGTIDA